VAGAIALSVGVMLLVFFAGRLREVTGLAWLGPVATLAWPWYVPLGTAITVTAGIGLSLLPARARKEP
jgi:hypothetical protein